jgi:anti-anti-sigma regulatory factor
MDSICVEYFVVREDENKILTMKMKDSEWSGGRLSPLFGEVAEGLFASTYSNICIDLSNLKTVSSGIFGACVNIVEAARSKSKNVKFKLNDDAFETAHLASFDKLVTVEKSIPGI